MVFKKRQRFGNEKGLKDLTLNNDKIVYILSVVNLTTRSSHDCE